MNCSRCTAGLLGREEMTGVCDFCEVRPRPQVPSWQSPPAARTAAGAPLDRELHGEEALAMLPGRYGDDAALEAAEARMQLERARAAEVGGSLYRRYGRGRRHVN